MSASGCTTAVPLPDLLAYSAGELDGADERALEEHLIACAECSERLAGLLNLSRAVRKELEAGRLSGVLPAAFVHRLKVAGMRVREYRIGAGGSVNCTVAPEDDFVASYLEAPLQGVRRLDVVFEAQDGARQRFEDIAFHEGAGEIVFVPSTVQLKQLRASTNRAHLIAVSEGAERVIGSYTFHHTPHR